MSDAEDALDFHLRALSINGYERQFKFCPSRRWLADFAWPPLHLIVEVDGGTWTNGRHNRGSGRVRDMERDNWCALNGWRVLRYTAQQARDGQAASEIAEVVKGE